MQIFIPFSASEFDGCSAPIGAYTSQQLAEQAYRTAFPSEGPSFSSLSVEVVELDAPCTFPE